jgi:HK97 family phage portal protein
LTIGDDEHLGIFNTRTRKEINALRSEIAGLKKKAAAKTPTGTRVLRTGSIWLPRFLRSDYTLQNSELIFSAVTRRANALSAMPLQLYRNAKQVRSPLNDIVNASPNTYMTSCQFFKTMEACCCTEGNTYALKVFDADFTLQSLKPLDPLRVEPVLETESGELWYRITPENGNIYYLHSFYIIHIPFISTNGIKGVNPVRVLFDTLTYNDQIQTFSASQLEKGVNAKIVAEAPANLGKEQREDTIAALVQTYKDTGGNILLLESGVQAKTLNLSPVDSQLFEVEKISRSKVAMVYNIPPHLLGDYSDVSFNSQEQQMLEFLMLTMLPIVTAYEQELNRKLLTQEERRRGYRFKFDMDAILRADAKTRAEVHQISVRGGFEKPNEARADYGRDSMQEGDKLLVSRDLTTLEYLVANPDKSTITNGGNDGKQKEKPVRDVA